jgi:hypothetical protein
MTNRLLRSFLSFAVVLGVACAVYAQQNNADRFIGEQLSYEGKVNRFKLSLAIADLTFTVSRPSGSYNLEIKTEATSKGTMLKLFRYSFLQQYTSIIDPATFRVLSTTKHDVQKQRVRDSEAVFDYGAKRVTYVETDPKDQSRPPRRIASEIGDRMNDMVSAIYAVRLRTLAVGDKFDLSVSDSGLVYKVPVSVTKRERLSTPTGKQWCMRLEPDLFGPGRLIERKGKMILWVTDDERRVPVRADIDSEHGKVEIKLKSVVNSVQSAPAGN